MKLLRQSKFEVGSSLAEVVCAVAILGICMAGLMGAIANGFFGMSLTRENQRATQIIMQQAELIRLYNWDELNTPNFIPTKFTTAYDPNNSKGQYGCTYTCLVSIAAAPFTSNYSTNMRQVTFTVNWSTKGIARSRSLTTLVSKDGMQNYVY